ncbi:MAG: hypothetical protein MUF73_12855, partial [Rhodobacteraceae bacterium]|nr:hypothetical protein [Paracoccaceae bacterium]
MNDMAPGQAAARDAGDTAGATPVPAGRLYGVIDVVRPNRIAGWAIDRADEGAAVQVDILRDGRVVATVTADRHRPDLQKGGIGTGRYGFLATLDPPLDPGFEFAVAAVARTPDGHSLTLRPVPGTLPEVPAERRMLQRLLEAMVDLQAAQARPAPVLAGLATTLDRIELVQARIEARLDTLERP